jgi:(p)ppGpp synthase/HD superfamily hydrolase
MSPPAPAGSTDLVLVTRVIDFAAVKHRGQRRKGAAGEPYFNHLEALPRGHATQGRDSIAVLGALLHDTIRIRRRPATSWTEFGEVVTRGRVTDDKRLPKAERKRLQVETAPHKSDRAKLIKIADKISNLRGIANSPPIDWDLARQREYFAWAARVVDGCRGVNPWLETIFDNAHRDGLARLADR